MSDIITGAVIALLGSSVGGFVTPLVLSCIEGNRIKKRQAREDSRERYLGLGTAIEKLLEALLEQFAHTDTEDSNALISVTKNSLLTSLRLGLLLTQEDQAIVVIVNSATEKIAAGDPLSEKILQTLSKVLLAWRRGTLSAEEALKSYQNDSDGFAATDPAPSFAT